MKKLLIIPALIILFLKTGYAQNYSFACISDIQIGQSNSSNDLQEIVRDINSRNNIKFVVLTGSQTAFGSDTQFEQVKNILDSLKVAYYLIPGINDIEFGQNEGSQFQQLFKTGNFSFEYDSVEHIGLNTSLSRNHYGHISIENLNWLDSTLKTIPKDRDIILYSSLPIDNDIDNWFALTNMLKDYNVKEFILSSSGKNKISEYSKIETAELKSSRRDKKSWNYTLANENSDSLYFYSITKDKKSKLWGTIKKDTIATPEIDSSQFEDYLSSFSKNNPKLKVNLLWKKNFDKTISSGICTGDNKIYVTLHDGEIFCFDNKGNEKWKYELNEPVASTPVEVNNNLVVGTLRGDLISLDANNGTVIQSIGLGVPITSQFITLGGEYNGERTTGVIIGTAKGDIYFYDVNTFELIWENHSAKGAIIAKPLLINRRIIYGSLDGFIYCIDASSGIINWKWTNGESSINTPAFCSPVTNGRNVFVVSPNKNIYAIDMMLGKTSWEKKYYNCFKSLSISKNNKQLFIKSAKDYFYKLNARTGREVKKINTDGGEDYLSNVPVEMNNNIIFGEQNGCIYLINSEDKCHKLFFLGNSPILNIAQLDKNIFIAGNRNGKVCVFNINYN